MDSRVAQLIADIQFETSLGTELDASIIRSDIVSLFGEVESEADRVALIRTFCATMNVAAKQLSAQGRQTDAFEAARISQMRVFLTQESSRSGSFDPIEFARVTRREMDAGRLPPNCDFADAAMEAARGVSDAGATAKPVRSEANKPVAKAKGWWGRTFGA